MTGTIRLGKGVRREAESEESRRRNRGCDVQEADMRLLQLGSPGSPPWSLHTGLLHGQPGGTAAEKSAAAIVA